MLGACSGGGSKDDDTGTTPSEACLLAAESQTCPECSTGTVTCTFGDTSATVRSCGDCQARGDLYAELCEEGETADRATIEAETVCGDPTCVVWTNSCDDPCTPLCVLADSVPYSTCDAACSTTPVIPGACEWDGCDCAFVE